MLIIAPWRTDAPVYYRPWATLGLILANILVYFILGVPDPPPETLWGTVRGKRGRVDAEDEDLYSLRRKRREFTERVHRAREAREAADQA